MGFSVQVGQDLGRGSLNGVGKLRSGDEVLGILTHYCKVPL